jgi:hypothetical protein
MHMDSAQEFTVGFWMLGKSRRDDFSLPIWRWAEGRVDLGLEWAVVVEAKDKFDAVRQGEAMLAAGVGSHFAAPQGGAPEGEASRPPGPAKWAGMEEIAPAHIHKRGSRDRRAERGGKQRACHDGTPGG